MEYEERDRDREEKNREQENYSLDNPYPLIDKKKAFRGDMEPVRVPPPRDLEYSSLQADLQFGLITYQEFVQQAQALNRRKVAELSPAEKLAEAVNRAARKLPGEVGQQLKAMFTPQALATIVVVLGVYLASHATGAGQAFDVAMLLVGGFYLGKQAFDVFKDLIGFAKAINAKTPEELDEAGECLARAVATVGIEVVMTLLTKKVAERISESSSNSRRSSNNLTESNNRAVSSLDNADNANPSRLDDAKNPGSTNSNNSRIEDSKTNTSSQVEDNINASERVDELSSNNRSRSRMNTGAKIGVAPSDYSIKVGTVRMKEHPDYRALIAEVESKGFKIVEDSEAHVSYIEVIDKKKKVIAVEKELHVIPDMRYIDLEHEVGHIRQLERFDGKLYTDRYIQRSDGSRKLYDNDLPHVLSKWQDTVTEYHNRLDEFLRLYERNANPELLLDHTKGINKWYSFFSKATHKGKSLKRMSWISQYFPDLKKLKSNYNNAISELRQTNPDLFSQERLQ